MAKELVISLEQRDRRNEAQLFRTTSSEDAAVLERVLQDRLFDGGKDQPNLMG